MLPADPAPALVEAAAAAAPGAGAGAGAATAPTTALADGLGLGWGGVPVNAAGLASWKFLTEADGPLASVGVLVADVMAPEPVLEPDIAGDRAGEILLDPFIIGLSGLGTNEDELVAKPGTDDCLSAAAAASRGLPPAGDGLEPGLPITPTPPPPGEVARPDRGASSDLGTSLGSTNVYMRSTKNSLGNSTSAFLRFSISMASLCKLCSRRYIWLKFTATIFFVKAYRYTPGTPSLLMKLV